ncbi:hypothetical protein HK405_009094, partial [Cladochytrium tenue]
MAPPPAASSASTQGGNPSDMGSPRTSVSDLRKSDSRRVNSQRRRQPLPTLPQQQQQHQQSDFVVAASNASPEVDLSHRISIPGRDSTNLARSRTVASAGPSVDSPDSSAMSTSPHTSSNLLRTPSKMSVRQSRDAGTFGKSSASLGRKKSLIKPERRVLENSTRARAVATLGRGLEHNSASLSRRRDLFNSLGRPGAAEEAEDGPKRNSWVVISRILTCCIPYRKSKDPYVQQAFREKLALCIIIFVLMAIVGFLTFGFQSSVCTQASSANYMSLSSLGYVGIHGTAWSLNSQTPHSDVYGVSISSIMSSTGGTDLSAMFPPSPTSTTSACRLLSTFPKYTCV